VYSYLTVDDFVRKAVLEQAKCHQCFTKEGAVALFHYIEAMEEDLNQQEEFDIMQLAKTFVEFEDINALNSALPEGCKKFKSVEEIKEIAIYKYHKAIIKVRRFDKEEKGIIMHREVLDDMIEKRKEKG